MCLFAGNFAGPQRGKVLLAMQKVVGSNPISRLYRHDARVKESGSVPFSSATASASTSDT
jgi:hypothetical protein